MKIKSIPNFENANNYVACLESFFFFKKKNPSLALHHNENLPPLCIQPRKSPPLLIVQERFSRIRPPIFTPAAGVVTIIKFKLEKLLIIHPTQWYRLTKKLRLNMPYEGIPTGHTLRG